MRIFKWLLSWNKDKIEYKKYILYINTHVVMWIHWHYTDLERLDSLNKRLHISLTLSYHTWCIDVLQDSRIVSLFRKLHMRWGWKTMAQTLYQHQYKESLTRCLKVLKNLISWEVKKMCNTHLNRSEIIRYSFHK